MTSITSPPQCGAHTSHAVVAAAAQELLAAGLVRQYLQSVALGFYINACADTPSITFMS